nr:hypothetical protein [Actinomycetota bacterium]
VDDIQAQLDQASSSFGVEAELAALKAETQGPNPAALPHADGAAATGGGTAEDDDNLDAVDAIEVDRNGAGGAGGVGGGGDGSESPASGKPSETATAGEATAP